MRRLNRTFPMAGHASRDFDTNQKHIVGLAGRSLACVRLAPLLKGALVGLQLLVERCGAVFEQHLVQPATAEFLVLTRVAELVGNAIAVSVKAVARLNFYFVVGELLISISTRAISMPSSPLRALLSWRRALRTLSRKLSSK